MRVLSYTEHHSRPLDAFNLAPARGCDSLEFRRASRELLDHVGAHQPASETTRDETFRPDVGGTEDA